MASIEKPEVPAFISKKKTAHLLGVSELSVDRRIREGSLSATRFGRRVLIPRIEIERLLKDALGEEA
jgi:excisionase family DNA binding protein